MKRENKILWQNMILNCFKDTLISIEANTVLIGELMDDEDQEELEKLHELIIKIQEKYAFGKTS